MSRPMHPCQDCGKPVRTSQKRCWACYKASAAAIASATAHGVRTRPCSGCEQPIRADHRLCRMCYNATRRRSINATSQVQARREPPVVTSGAFTHLPAPQGAFCPDRRAHWWDLDRTGYGTCRYCNEERQFPNFIGAERNWMSRGYKTPKEVRT